MSKRIAQAIFLGVLLLASAACSDSKSSDDATSTSSDEAAETTIAGASGVSGGGSGTAGSGGSAAGGSTATTAGATPPNNSPNLAFVVPLVEGQTEQRANELIQAAGLTMTIRSVPNAATRGTVITQTPRPGVTLTSGANVEVLVSQGQVIAEIPRVVGLCSREAESLLNNAGFRVRLTFDRNSTRILNRVESQNPGGGIFDQQGSEVVLVVSLNTQGQGLPC